MLKKKTMGILACLTVICTATAGVLIYRNVGRMFDFKQDCIKPEGLHEGWQTGGTVRLTRLAFNLWNGYAEQGDERMSRKMDILSGLRKQNSYYDTRGYRIETISSFLPEVQTGDID